MRGATARKAAAHKAEKLVGNGTVERISALELVGGFVLRARFADGCEVEADLAGLIDRSPHFRVFAEDREAFERFALVDGGSGIEWENGVDFSAGALLRLGLAQVEMTGAAFADWIKAHSLSLNEAADLFGVTRHTIMNYRRRQAVPQPIKIMCDAMDRDPTLFYARLRPRRPGRPHKSRAA